MADSSQTVRIIRVFVSSPSDVSKGHTNQRSPIGSALLGSELGEEVEVNLPGGSRVLIVKEIKKRDG